MTRHCSHFLPSLPVFFTAAATLGWLALAPAGASAWEWPSFSKPEQPPVTGMPRRPALNPGGGDVPSEGAGAAPEAYPSMNAAAPGMMGSPTPAPVPQPDAYYPSMNAGAPGMMGSPVMEPAPSDMAPAPAPQQPYAMEEMGEAPIALRPPAMNPGAPVGMAQPSAPLPPVTETTMELPAGYPPLGSVPAAPQPSYDTQGADAAMMEMQAQQQQAEARQRIIEDAYRSESMMPPSEAAMAPAPVASEGPLADAFNDRGAEQPPVEYEAALPQPQEPYIPPVPDAQPAMPIAPEAYYGDPVSPDQYGYAATPADVAPLVPPSDAPMAYAPVEPVAVDAAPDVYGYGSAAGAPLDLRGPGVTPGGSGFNDYDAGFNNDQIQLTEPVVPRVTERILPESRYAERRFRDRMARSGGLAAGFSTNAYDGTF